MHTSDQNAKRTGPDDTAYSENSVEHRGANGGGLKFSRRFTQKDIHPYEEIRWEQRSAAITNDKGEVIFEADDVLVPSFWIGKGICPQRLLSPPW